MARNNERLYQEGIHAFNTASAKTFSSKACTKRALTAAKHTIANHAGDPRRQAINLHEILREYLTNDIYRPGAKAGAFVDFIIAHYHKIFQFGIGPALSDPATITLDDSAAASLVFYCLRSDNLMRTSTTYSNFKYRESLRKLLKLFGSVAAYINNNTEDLDSIKTQFTTHIDNINYPKNTNALNALLDGFIAAQTTPNATAAAGTSSNPAPATPTIPRTLTALETAHPHTVLDNLLTALDNSTDSEHITQEYRDAMRAFLTTPNVGTTQQRARGVFSIICAYIRETFFRGENAEDLLDMLMEFIPKLMDLGADTRTLLNTLFTGDEAALQGAIHTSALGVKPNLDKLALLISATSDYYSDQLATMREQIQGIMGTKGFSDSEKDAVNLYLDLPAPHVRAFLALERCKDNIHFRSNTEKRHRLRFLSKTLRDRQVANNMATAFTNYCVEFIGRGKDCRAVFATLAEYLPPILAADENAQALLTHLIETLTQNHIIALIGETFFLKGNTVPHNVDAMMQLLANVLLAAKHAGIELKTVCASITEAADLSPDEIEDIDSVLHALADDLFNQAGINAFSYICLSALLSALGDVGVAALAHSLTITTTTPVEDAVGMRDDGIISRVPQHPVVTTISYSLIERISQACDQTPEQHTRVTKVLIDFLNRVLPDKTDLEAFTGMLDILMVTTHNNAAMIEALCTCIPGLASTIKLSDFTPSELNAKNLVVLLTQQKQDNPAAFDDFDLGPWVVAAHGLKDFDAASEQIHGIIVQSFDAQLSAEIHDDDDDAIAERQENLLLSELYEDLHRYVKVETHNSKEITRELFDTVQTICLLTDSSDARMHYLLLAMNTYMEQLFTRPETRASQPDTSAAGQAAGGFHHPGGMFDLCLDWMQKLLPLSADTHNTIKTQLLAEIADSAGNTEYSSTFRNAAHPRTAANRLLNAYTRNSMATDNAIESFTALARYLGMLFPSVGDDTDNAVYQAVLRKNDDLRLPVPQVRGTAITQTTLLPISAEDLEAYFTPPAPKASWSWGIFGGGSNIASTSGVDDAAAAGAAGTLSPNGSGGHDA